MSAISSDDAPPPERPATARWTRFDWLALALVTLGAAIVRLAGLDRPTTLVFDEIFYARDACWYVIADPNVCGIGELTSRAHPPLGKWLIGAGIAAFGYEPFGWRASPALAGTLTVALVYVLARRLAASVLPASAAVVAAFGAAGLLATDFLHLVQSRVAMLDVLITLFVVLAMLAIVLDRDRTREPSRTNLLYRLTLGRPWRLAAGAALGAAAATKWSGAYVALALIGLTIAWEVRASYRSRGGSWRTVWEAVRREAAPTVLLLGLMPLLVYLLSYTGRMSGVVIGAPWEPATVWRGIWEHQVAMLNFHTSLTGHHPYESPPWSWPLLKRPVAFFFTDVDGASREILAMGNPVVWWPGIAAFVVIAVSWIRARLDLGRPEPVVLAAAVATYGPWLVLSGSRSQVFLWYLLPTIPFMCIGLGLVAGWLWGTLAGRGAVVVAGLLVVASFGFFFPILTGLPLDQAGWRTRMWFTDCERPGAQTLTLPDDEINRGSPPDGWCWI